MDICITVVETSYDNRSLYVSLEVKLTLIDVGSNLRNSRLSAIARLGLLVGDYLSA